MSKYRKFKCYSCGKKDEVNGIVCKNLTSPNRNDEYGKDGYTLCCPACKNKIGKEKYFNEEVKMVFKTPEDLRKEKEEERRKAMEKF